MTDLSVIVVTFECRDFVSNCLDAIHDAAAPYAAEVIVVDNASPDGTAGHVRQNFPEVEVIDMGRNAGFSAANNRGVRAASGRHVLLLNPDAVPAPGALGRMIEFLDATPAAGVAAPRLRNVDGTDQGTARAFPTPAAALFGRRSPLRRLFPRNRWSRRFLTGLAQTGDTPFEVDWVSGAALMVPRDVFDTVGGLDDGFFMHFEDADFCRRVKDAGRTVWCVAAADVVHAEGGSRRGWPVRQVWYFHRGAYRFHAKHGLRGWRLVLRPIAALALSVRATGVVVANGRRARA